MNLDINHFKNQLSDYNYLVSKIARLEEMKLEFETKRGLHGVRYDREPVQGSKDPLIAELNRLNDVDKADYLDRELRRHKARLNSIESFLSRCRYGASIKKIHCLGISTYEAEAKSMFMGTKTLKRRINKEILNYINCGQKISWEDIDDDV